MPARASSTLYPLAMKLRSSIAGRAPRWRTRVLFDSIEEKHAEEAPLEEALLDTGTMRLRPVLITVGATVIALLPLASHGGPLWEPMCCARISGLTVATFVTLQLVPVIYSILVLDLKLVRWERGQDEHSAVAAPLGR